MFNISIMGMASNDTIISSSSMENVAEFLALLFSS